MQLYVCNTRSYMHLNGHATFFVVKLTHAPCTVSTHTPPNRPAPSPWRSPLSIPVLLEASAVLVDVAPLLLPAEACLSGGLGQVSSGDGGDSVRGGGDAERKTATD